MLGNLPIRELVRRELDTDKVQEDVTARLLGESGERPTQAWIRSRETGVYAGEAILKALRSEISALKFQTDFTDGRTFEAGETLVTLEGSGKDLLAVERTALNLLGLSTGVATLTRRYVEAIRPFPTEILATRKTLPGLREVQLLAVVAGGGKIHRRSLADGILIKDNHITVAGEKALLEKAAQTRSPLHGIEIEVQSLESLKRVLESPLPDVIMLDNLSVEEMRLAIQQIKTVSALGAEIRIEASGGVNLETVRAIAETGVDYISVGALTHSARSLNLTLDIAL